jgi:hypothetical protein
LNVRENGSHERPLSRRSAQNSTRSDPRKVRGGPVMIVERLFAEG